jgi:hypothetical protein
MPIESALVWVFVLVVFTGFALVLAWVEQQTRDLETASPQKPAVRSRESLATGGM